MIKVNKDSENVPASLNNATTQKRRDELIEVGRYIDESKYNNRYKGRDVKSRLKKLYRGKCAFCEQCIEQFHVEHFRPKRVYYWLAYSWDNLLAVCPTCNQYKSDHFETLRKRVTLANDEPVPNQIHWLTKAYNEREGNRLVCPEQEAVGTQLIFEKDGSIHSEDERVKYTIETCRLNRNDLKDQRKKLWDDLERKLISRFYEHQLGNSEAKFKMIGLQEDFVKDARNLDNTFIAFRQYAVHHFLLKASD